MTTQHILTDLPLDDIAESPFQPRQIYRELDELAVTIREQGILQPLLVRPRDPRHGGLCAHELIFGHRRARAAALAGLARVPCRVVAMTDAEVRAAQAVENLQRADVHPFEEAAAFRMMIDAGDATAEQLAARFGKSVSYVYGRLKLLQACAEVRDACLAGKIGAEVALLVARLRTEGLQQKALAAIKANAYRANLEDGGKDSYRAVRELLLEKFSLELKGALFALDDATLVPDAGACTACPKRTGNAPEFADVAAGKKAHSYSAVPAGPDVCTDPECFATKKAAHLKRAAQALQAKGKTVVDGAKARQAIGADGKVKGAYVALSDVKHTLAKAAAKGKPAPTIVTLQDPRNGKTVQAVKRDDLAAAGVKLSEPRTAKSGSSNTDHAAERQARDAKVAAATAANVALLHRVRAATAGQPPGLLELRLIVECLLEGVLFSDDSPVLAALYNVEHERQIEQLVPTLDAQGLTRLAIDCALIDGITSTYWESNKPERLLQMAEAHGVPLVASEVADEPSTPSPAAPATKKTAKGSKAKAAQPDLLEAAGA